MAFKYDEYGSDRDEVRSERKARSRELGCKEGLCTYTWTKWDSRVVMQCGKCFGHDGEHGKGMQIGSDGRRW